MTTRNKISKISMAVILIVFTSWSVMIFASSGGKTGRTLLSGTPGCTCHGSSATPTVNVVIDGPDTLEIGATGTYMVTITGGPLSAAGVNIATDGGDLNIVDSKLQKSGGELTHTSPNNASSGSVVFNYEFTAPASAGQVTMAATGNSVNLSGSNAGDNWNHAMSKTIEVVTTTSITDLVSAPRAFNLEQNYPNPFNPGTKIRYNVANAGKVVLEVFDMLGKKVTTLVNSDQPAGSYTVDFNGSDLNSGTYIYRLSANGKVESRRMTLLK